MYMDVTLEKLHAVEELTFTFVYATKTFRPHHYQRTVTYLLTYHVCGLSVCLLVKSVSCAAQNETAEPSKLSFRVWTHRSPRNHVLHGSMVPPWEERTLLGVGGYTWAYQPCLRSIFSTFIRQGAGAMRPWLLVYHSNFFTL